MSLPYAPPAPGEDWHEHFFVPQRFVAYDYAGRIVGGGRMALAVVENRRAQGEMLALVDDAVGTEDSAEWAKRYFDFGAHAVRLRPEMAGLVSEVHLAPGSDVPIGTFPAAKVSITGPVTTTVWHVGGDFSIGFAMPGTYSIEVECWPSLPVTVTAIVSEAS